MIYVPVTDLRVQARAEGRRSGSGGGCHAEKQADEEADRNSLFPKQGFIFAGFVCDPMSASFVNKAKLRPVSYPVAANDHRLFEEVSHCRCACCAKRHAVSLIHMLFGSN